MLFKRKKPQSLITKMRQSVWPSMGWHRAIDYFRHRVFRRARSPYEVTAGFAVGAAVSFVPLLGTHWIQAIFFAWMLRANMVAAFVGTAFGNPWTFPFLFWLDYQVGEYLFGLFGADVLTLPPDIPGWSYLLDHPLQLFLPLLVGGYICTLLFFPLAYGLLYYPVRGLLKAYNLQRAQRIEKRKGLS
jgi:hypothetical protein